MIFEEENHSIEYKSLDKTEGKSKLRELACECVCFANAQGGTILIGLDDKTKKPPSSQTVSQDKINTTLKTLRGFTNSVGLAEPKHIVHENGGEYFSFKVLPSLKTVTMTSDGKVAIRIGEECVPVDSQSLTQLVSEKGDFQWELVRHTVIRELLVNAFVHQSYTISGDIFIRVYVDRLEITNPGGLPLGITKENILHHTRRKNPHMIDIFKALGLMEGEGSGYDLIYEKLSLDAKKYPEIENDIDYVKVSIFSIIISQDVLKLLDYAMSHFQLTQKEIITLGIIAREKKVTATELSRFLQLGNDGRLRGWVSSLVKKNILLTQGKTKGLTYLINHELLSAVEQNIKPSLKTLEPHALKALIYEDLKIHSGSSKSEIASRLPDIKIKDIQKILYFGVENGDLLTEGANKNRTYILANKK